MSEYEGYIFVLCLVVFLVLTVFISSLLFTIFSLSKKNILYGAEDQRIIREYKKRKLKKGATNLVGRFFSISLVITLCFILGASIVINVTDSSATSEFATVRVVESNSMATKNENNKYLFENNLDDQFQMFDLIITHKMPAEDELELYDIVVYEFDDILVIHRIVAIEEPNESHPDCRYFMLKGDANTNDDRFPVLYSQMKGIYEGEKVRFIGSFVLFLQSPAGYICILLMIITTIGYPILERKLLEVEEYRLEGLGIIQNKVKEVKKHE